MKKVLIVILSCILFIDSLSAVSSSEVNYKVDDFIVDSMIDSIGNLTVKEVIKVKGTFNGYIRDLVYKNSKLSDFTGADSDFEGSSIYNATGLEIQKVGKISWDESKDLDYEVFLNDIQEFSECEEGNNCYKKSDIQDGTSLKMYSETKSDSTYFYIEYLLGNVVVQHNDVHELYYNFIGNGFDDDIKKYKLRVLLPQTTKEQVRVWAHGPLNGEVYFVADGDPITYYGAYLTVDDLYAHTPVDIRMVFPKDLLSVYFEGVSKLTNIDALDKILLVEEARANEANNLRNAARTKVYGTYIISGIYLLITLTLIVYIYFKYDKEFKSNFLNEYNREFIDDYDVTVIEYLFSKTITSKAFSTSLLNLIYKKNIKVEEIEGNKNKKDYLFTLLNQDNLIESERKLVNIIFNNAGNTKEVKLSEIQKYAKKMNGTSSYFLSDFDDWKNSVVNDAQKEEFYINVKKVKAFFSLYCIVGLIILFIHFSIDMFNIVTILVLVVTIIFFIYLMTFTKRSFRGNDHYIRWKAFKKFLNDFGRFDEKELPEISLWERYLVYANIFGIADKVSKTMNIKFNEMGYQNNNVRMYNYMMWSNLNSSINRTVNNSVSEARSLQAQALASSTNSSAGGFGGGFSSGGGFGGGGGGGRGF